MLQQEKVTQEDIDQASVRLKPLLGLKPGAWLAALYGTILAIIAFLAFVLPGLSSPGTLVRFESSPPGAAVFVDGVWRGATPFECFLPAGERRVKASLRGYDAQERSYDSGSRLFFSALIPKRDEIAFSLSFTPGGAEDMLGNGLAEFSSWALTGPQTATYRRPTPLLDAIETWAASPEKPSLASGYASSLARSALAYAADADAAREAAMAICGLVRSGVLDITETVSAISAAPAFEAFLLASAPPELALAYAASPGLSEYSSGIVEAIARDRASARVPQRVMVGTRPFRSFLPADAVFGSRGEDSPPVAYEAFPIRTGAFLLAETEVTREDYALFISAEPSWGPAGKDALIAKGLVDPSYLVGWDDPSASPREPARYISWHAAKAYCEWYSRSLSPGMRARLPLEEEWELAALRGRPEAANAVLADSRRLGPEEAGRTPADRAGLRDMLGNVWEWTGSPFASHPAFSLGVAGILPGAEMAVRGGCFGNKASMVSPWSRGSFDPRRCSAFLGFRLLIVEDRP